MPDTIKDGTGGGSLAKVTASNRLRTEAITQSIAADRSSRLKLFSVGTGVVTPTSGGSRSMLWLKNIGVEEDLYVHKIIMGWNGGSTNFNRTVRSLITYNNTVPTANNTELDDACENIKAVGVESGNVLAYGWDGVSTGMTSGSGGTPQVGNRLAQGNNVLAIDGEIILGPGDSMEIAVTPEETGLFEVAIVYYFQEAE